MIDHNPRGDGGGGSFVKELLLESNAQLVGLGFLAVGVPML